MGIILPCNQDIANVKALGKLFLLAVFSREERLRGGDKILLAPKRKKNYLIFNHSVTTYGHPTMKVLLTGSAGFIGFHLAERLGFSLPVVNLDSINDYYDVSLKYARLAQLGFAREQIRAGELISSRRFPEQRFIQLSLSNKAALSELFAQESFTHVIHLAAQAGVRYSLEQPDSYSESNLSGFLPILEGARHTKVQHLIYASTSSVYGLNETLPFSTSHSSDHPLSLYAATKKANELMAHAYSHLFALPTTGLRFFTVYGPWGRPDMALFKFTQAILANQPIPVFNEGKLKRDFTFIDDITAAIAALLNKAPEGDPRWDPRHPELSSSSAPYRLFNVGASQPVGLRDFISCLEQCLGKKAQLELLPMQAGDVAATWADASPLAQELGFSPSTPLAKGVEAFVRWYRHYYGV